MTRTASLILAACLAAATLSAAGEPAAPQPSSDLARCYWRYHWTFRPAEFLGLDGKLYPLATRFSALNTSPTANRLSTEGPADGWTGADFDDSGWDVLRQPMPILPEVEQDSGDQAGIYPAFIIRRMCARTRFTVTNPAEVRSVKLELAYHGGVILTINGKEVARGHIPKDGPLAEGLHGEPYPVGAYRPTTPEQESWGLMSQSGVWSQIGMGQAGWYWLVEKKPEAKEKYEHAQFIRGIRERKLSVELTAAMLKPGINVLAIESRCSPIPELSNAQGKAYLAGPGMQGVDFAHIGLSAVRFNAGPESGVGPADKRPDGVQAWAEDIHRWMLEEDYLEPGVKERRAVKLIGARGGTYSGQVVIGTSRDLANPSAVLTDLQGPGGATLPASMARIRWARSIDLKTVKNANPGAFRTHMQHLALMRYRNLPFFFGGHPDRVSAAWAKPNAPLRLYDQLSPDPPAKIAAGTCQPVWLTLDIPADARPGSYKATLKVRADGLTEVAFEVGVEVCGFKLPAPAEFKQYVGIDESPWALAKACKVPLWSEDHWKLIEESIRAAGQLGARVVSIPAIQSTEVGNAQDTMIKWVKKGEGAYSFDFALADRYLTLWRKYCHPQSDVIVYLILPAGNDGRGGGTGTVNVLDPAPGQASPFKPPQPDTPEGRKLWVDCAKAVAEHFKTLGFPEKNLHWGLFDDYVGPTSQELVQALNAEIPGVGWARSCHDGRPPFKKGAEGKVSWHAAVRGCQAPPFGGWKQIPGKPSYYRDAGGYAVQDHQGWNNPGALILLPRADSDVCALQMYSPLFQMRAMPELVATSKYRGFGRVCVDGWGRGGYFGPFTPYLLYPGKPGQMDGSAQYEILREGIQEAEAHIAIQSGGAPAAARDILARRTEMAWIMPVRVAGQRIAEYHGGWQERSRALYEAAGK